MTHSLNILKNRPPSYTLWCGNFISSKHIMESSNMENTLKDTIICTSMQCRCIEKYTKLKMSLCTIVK